MKKSIQYVGYYDDPKRGPRYRNMGWNHKKILKDMGLK